MNIKTFWRINRHPECSGWRWPGDEIPHFVSLHSEWQFHFGVAVLELGGFAAQLQYPINQGWLSFRYVVRNLKMIICHW